MTPDHLAQSNWSPLGVHFVERRCVSPAGTHLLEWLAISLTPGLDYKIGQTGRAFWLRKGGLASSSLTVLESPGLQTVSARSLAPGKSEGLACDLAAQGLVIINEWQGMRGMARGVDVVDDPTENSRISEQLRALSGALIPEFP